MELNDVGRLLMSVTRKVKKTASQIVHPLTQLEKWLKEATSNTNWGCSSTILNEISRSMTDYHDYVIVQKCIGDCLSEKSAKWRRIFKTLVLVEYLLKNGIDRFVEDFKEYIYKVRHLQDFYYTEEGKDKGAGIREKSKYILNLMNDPILLKSERKKAKDNRGKYIGINGKNSGIILNKSFSKNTNTNTNTNRIGELYDPYCISNSGDNYYNNSSIKVGSNVSDGLEVIKNVGISIEEQQVDVSRKHFSDINHSVKLPCPPSYSVSNKLGVGGGGMAVTAATGRSGGMGRVGIRRLEEGSSIRSETPSESKCIFGDSILNAAKKLANDEESLQSLSDWSTFMGAETRGEVEIGGGIQEEIPSSKLTSFNNDEKSKSATLLNPFDPEYFKAQVRTEACELDIESKKNVMKDLLDLDTNLLNQVKVKTFETGFIKDKDKNKHPNLEERHSHRQEDYLDAGQDNKIDGHFHYQENGGSTMSNMSKNHRIHIPYGF